MSFIQSTSENKTDPVFECLILVRLSNGPVFEGLKEDGRKINL
jgi:hypothetical protein